jgi:ribosomal-protein-alanine N-acetyltransferase
MTSIRPDANADPFAPPLSERASDAADDRAEKLRFSPMGLADLDEVLRIEYAIYPFPWTRGNFLDSLYSRYDTWILRNPEGELVGYFLLMIGVDE